MSDTVCAHPVHWHGENLDAVCQLPFGHQPSDQHCDGLWWFDNHGLRLPRTAAVLSIPAVPSGWQHEHSECRSPAQHGTSAGYHHHHYRDEQACRECLTAVQQYEAGRRSRRAAS